MKKLSFLLLLIALFNLSCSNNSSQGDAKEVSMSKEAFLKKIKDQEKKVFSQSPEKLNDLKLKELADQYVEYALYGDSLAPEFLYKAAGIYMNTGKPKKAISSLNKIINHYPDFNKLENCYFLKAFVYDDKLKDYSNAGKFYKEYLNKYPKGVFADDAKLLIKNLGKSTEEIFKEIKKE
jgi:tetratricopeptide (TPR) repeat protein